MAKQSAGKTIDRSEPTCDPIIVATSFGNAGKHRFFMFSRRDWSEDGQRDVCNEKPIMPSGTITGNLFQLPLSVRGSKSPSRKYNSAHKHGGYF